MRGKRFSERGQIELLPRDVHQVCGVATIDDGELRAEAELTGVLAQKARADGMKCSRPQQPTQGFTQRTGGARFFCASVSAMMCWARRIISCAARRLKVMSSSSCGRDAIEQQMRDAMSEGVRLASAGARDDQQRRGGEATFAQLPKRRRALLSVIERRGRPAGRMESR